MERIGTLVAVTAAGLAGAFLLWPAERAVAPSIVAATPSTVETAITVHVAGLVATPGLVAVPARSRVADVIVAAGGAIDGADLSLLNLASPVVDGQHLVVPGSGDGATAIAGTAGVAINRADADALETLPGVGPVLASRIVAHRDQHGPFRVVEDLLDVPGIGESKLAALRDSVTVP